MKCYVGTERERERERERKREVGYLKALSDAKV